MLAVKACRKTPQSALFRAFDGIVPLALAFALALLSVAGCTQATEVELLSLSGVDGEVLEGSTTLRIRGEGFVPGGDAEVRWLGQLHRPGQRPWPVDVGGEAHAISAQELSFEVRESWLRGFGGRGTFEGELEVRFRAADAVVHGRLPLRQDVLPRETRAGLRDRRSLEQSGRDLGERWGLGFAEEDPDAADGVGLLVEEVRPGSWAAEGGVQAGDRLRELAGVRLRGLQEVQAPVVATAEAVFVREGRQAEMRLFLPGAAVSTEAQPIHPITLVLLAIAALCAVVWGPLAGVIQSPLRLLREKPGPPVLLLLLTTAVAALSPTALMLVAILLRLGLERSPREQWPVAFGMGALWLFLGRPLHLVAMPPVIDGAMPLLVQPVVTIVVLAAATHRCRPRARSLGLRGAKIFAAAMELGALASLASLGAPPVMRIAVGAGVGAMALMLPRPNSFSRAVCVVGAAALGAATLLDLRGPRWEEAAVLLLWALAVLVLWAWVRPPRSQGDVHLYL